MAALWRVHLLGDLRVESVERTITRFRTQKTGSLLAYLAYNSSRSHPRDALIEMLWPDDDVESGRHKLRNALTSLRRQLEPPGIPAGAVIVTDRADVQLNPAAVDTDAAEFELSLQTAERAGSDAERALLLEQAVDLYRGDLLPGYYEDWIMPERQRLSEGYLLAIRRLIQYLEQARNWPRALEYARRAVSADPLREEAHRELMRLLALSGQPVAALQQYRELERVLREEMGETPDAATRQLARLLESDPLSLQTEVAVTQTPAPPAEEERPESEEVDSWPRPAAPVGTVTFLLTDIEGSTTGWEPGTRAAGGGETLRTALADHPPTAWVPAMLRREFRRHGGYEVREAGDAFVVAFAGAHPALACALAALRALAEQARPARVSPIRVRIALHTGDVELEEDGYHDLVLHHASRMLMAAHGGQILCSEVTAGLLRRGAALNEEAAQQRVRLTDLGIYRLRGVATPERLFQVSDPEMSPQEFPPLKAERAFTSNLPLQFTRFFGRKKEISELAGMLSSREGTRLVTVTGPGGSGKSRLALETAGGLVEPLRGAVWFVPLADLSDPSLILDAILGALRLPRSPEATPMEQITEALSPQPTLLLLDNFEHLVDEGAPLIRALIEQLPALQCLVTSRRPLGLEGEREFPLLPLPTPGERERLERLTLYDSVQLFIDRAQAARPDFQVTHANAAAVAALCQRLEGIPLGRVR